MSIKFEGIDTVDLIAKIDSQISLTQNLDYKMDLEAEISPYINLIANIEDLVLGIFLITEDEEYLLFEDNFKIILE